MIDEYVGYPILWERGQQREVNTSNKKSQEQETTRQEITIPAVLVQHFPLR